MSTHRRSPKSRRSPRNGLASRLGRGPGHVIGAARFLRLRVGGTLLHGERRDDFIGKELERCQDLFVGDGLAGVDEEAHAVDTYLLPPLERLDTRLGVA